MDIKTLTQNVKKQNLPKGEYAIFGSATMAIRGMREAPNIDVIVTDALWTELLKTEQPDDEGFIRLNGRVKVSNWWFAPTRKTIPQMISEAEDIDGLPFVKLEEVLSYKKGLGRDKDKEDVKLIEAFMKNPVGLGYETYKDFIGDYVKEIKELPIVGLMIFGSVARGQAKADSDIDMFHFYTGNRDDINDKVLKIIIKLRDCSSYKSLTDKNIYPEIYPFFISKDSKETLPVFWDATEHGVILFDDGTIKNLVKQVDTSKRKVLPNGKWVWIV